MDHLLLFLLFLLLLLSLLLLLFSNKQKTKRHNTSECDSQVLQY